jgi:hypothetical protein
MFVCCVDVRVELLHQRPHRLRVAILRIGPDGGCALRVGGVDVRVELLHQRPHSLRVAQKRSYRESS